MIERITGPISLPRGKPSSDVDFVSHLEIKPIEPIPGPISLPRGKPSGAPPFFSEVRAVSGSNPVLTEDDNGKLIAFDPGGVIRQITLPDSTTLSGDFRVGLIKTENSTTGTMRVITSGADEIYPGQTLISYRHPFVLYIYILDKSTGRWAVSGNNISCQSLNIGVSNTGAGSLITDISANPDFSGASDQELATRKAIQDFVEEVAVPSNLISGLNCSNNVTDSDHDIDIAVGKARDFGDAVTMALSSILTKRIDASWSVGTNQGGLDTGTVAAATGYGIYLIGRSDTGVIDAILSTDKTPDGLTLTLPANYDQFRLIAFGTTDAGANLTILDHTGDVFIVNNPDINIVDSSPSGFNTVTMELPSSSLVYSYVQQDLSVTSTLVRWAINNPTEGLANIFAGNLQVASAFVDDLAIPIWVLLDSSSQIQYHNVSPTTNTTFVIEPRICHMLTRSNPK